MEVFGQLAVRCGVCLTLSKPEEAILFGHSGQLALGDSLDRHYLTRVSLPVDRTAVDVALGDYHLGVVLDNGDVYTAGQGSSVPSNARSDMSNRLTSFPR